jgi:hypothetical protein
MNKEKNTATNSPAAARLNRVAKKNPHNQLHSPSHNNLP